MKKFINTVLFFLFVTTFAFAAAGGNYTPSAEAKAAPSSEDVTVLTELPDSTEIIYENKYDFPNKEGFVQPEDLEAYDEASFIEGVDEEEIEPIIYVTEYKGPEASVIGAVLKKYVAITPYKDRNTLSGLAKEEFQDAYNELKDAEVLSDVVEELLDYFTEDEVKEYTVTQIFYLWPREDIVSFIDTWINLNLRMIYTMPVKDGALPPVMCYRIAGSKDWGAINPANVIEDWLESGTFAADFHNFGTVVFLEPKKN